MEANCDCGWELPKEIDLAAENKGFKKLGRMVITVICPICNSPHYSMGDESIKNDKNPAHRMYV
ncbi:MAG: hypothetical protein ACE5J2_07815 [Nitrososphaerales archaeon]